MKKYDESAPHEIMLTLDAGTGQNAISQAKLFNEAVGLTGISLTKLDGTAKGGVIFAIADQFNLPIRYIGVGEKLKIYANSTQKSLSRLCLLMKKNKVRLKIKMFLEIKYDSICKCQ